LYIVLRFVKSILLNEYDDDDDDFARRDFLSPLTPTVDIWIQHKASCARPG